MILHSRSTAGVRRCPLGPFVAVGSVALVALTLIAIGSGGVSIPASSIAAHGWAELTGALSPLSARDQMIIGTLRLPRIVLAMVVGAALATSGAALQGLFRNPLADPGLIGVSSGAALAAAAALVSFGSLVSGVLGSWSLPLAAFSGAILATAVVYVLSRHNGTVSVTTMLLAGIAINALAGAGIGLFSYLGDDLQLRQLTFWMLGSLATSQWSQILPAGAMMLVATGALLLLSRKLDVMVLGNRDAHALGVRPQTVIHQTILAVALAIGSAVAVSGMIGFVGLVVPHVARLLLGPSHRVVMPACLVLGPLVVMVADTLARTIALPAEVPIGLLLSLIGAPFFLWLLRRASSMGV